MRQESTPRAVEVCGVRPELGHTSAGRWAYQRHVTAVPADGRRKPLANDALDVFMLSARF
jgi:hypothetical protein